MDFNYRLVLAEEDLATEMMEKIGSAKPVHYRTFDLAEIECDTENLEPLVDRLQRFQRAHVDLVDRRTHQHHMLSSR